MFRKLKIFSIVSIVLLAAICIPLAIKNFGSHEETLTYNSVSMFTAFNDNVEKKMCLPIKVVQIETDDSLKFVVNDTIEINYKVKGRDKEGFIYTEIVSVKGVEQSHQRMFGSTNIVTFIEKTDNVGNRVLLFKETDYVFFRFSTGDCLN